MTDTATGMHIPAIKLRRLSAGELAGAEASEVEAHAASCAACRARWKEITDEQRRFEQEISFDRFAAGVERAARAPRALPSVRAAVVRRWATPMLAMAAAVALTVTFAPRATNRTKGGAGMTVQIAPAEGPQRRIASPTAIEPLAPGERIRVGYQSGGHDFVTVVSVDDQGQVTALYPEAGKSLGVPRLKGGASDTTIYFPDSVEFTGKGAERLIVVLGDKPIDVAAVKEAAARAFRRARGDVAHLPPLDVPGEQFQRTFLKP